MSPGYNMAGCYAFSRKSGIPPLATNRVCLIREDQFPLHRILRAVALNSKLSRLRCQDICQEHNFLNAPPGDPECPCPLFSGGGRYYEKDPPIMRPGKRRHPHPALPLPRHKDSGIFDKGEVWAADTTSGFIRGGSTSRNCSKEGQSIYLGEYTMLLKGRSPLYSSE